MALLDSQVSVLANQALNWMVSGKVPHRMGNGHSNLVPYQAFKVADGEVIVAVGNDRQFERLCALLGVPDLAADERFRTNPDRVRNRETLIPIIAQRIGARRREEFAGGLEAAGIPAGPINSVDAVFADPQVVHRGLRLEGEPPGLASPIVIDGKRQVAPRRSPRLGEDEAAFQG
jgi:crotonobetainyl-CoA:carnitine CoA-transferase CaiB-like acyl-CoA transferase